ARSHWVALNLKVQYTRSLLPTQNKKPLSFIRHQLRLKLLSLIYNTFTNMRSRRVHIGNEKETIALPMNFGYPWYRL
ncbi:MAG: hypothetical protein V7K67_17680, partial [Nostoc sp.]|uniref:hypothetical protein n=1 Tax=Nostoc sp. TaxID=1180 RepID=UPI002FF58C31